MYNVLLFEYGSAAGFLIGQTDLDLRARARIVYGGEGTRPNYT